MNGRLIRRGHEVTLFTSGNSGETSHGPTAIFGGQVIRRHMNVMHSPEEI
jgi:hypothetical protein